ncbi:MAG: PAS domain S-box protein [Chloroflexi bacterium]|nr:PAS domain S-box protein [Chloroflexota bacterium]
MTEPPQAIVEPEARQRARAVTSTLVLTLLLVAIPMLQRFGNGEVPVFLVMILLITTIAYGFSRVGATQIAGILAIMALWVLPTFAIVIGYSSTTTFILTVVRLLLLALLFSYLLFSLRMCLVLAGAMVIGFLLIPPYARIPMSQAQLASDFLLTAAATFFVFIITRQYDRSGRHEAEERYRAVVEVQSELVSRWLPDTTLTFVNETYCRYFLKTREEMIGTRFSDFLNAEDMEPIYEAIKQITRENPSYFYEHRVILLDGSITWQQWTDHAIFDEQGNILEYQSVGHDITERKLAEQALAESEERYRAIVETQTELILRWRPDHTITYINHACQQYFGTPQREIIGSKIMATVVADDVPHVLAMIATIDQEHPTASYECRVINPRGELRWHQWTDHAIFDDFGKVVEYQSVGQDVTQRKFAEQALAESEERYRAIVEIQTELICRWLPDHSITYVNSAYCQYFNITRETLVGSQVLALIHPDDLNYVTQMIATISRERPTVTYEHRVHNAKGELRWQQWTDQAIFDDFGKVVEYQSVGHDITDLKRAEEAEREQRQFAEALSTTAALISSTLNVDEVLDRILSQVAAVHTLSSAEVLLIDGRDAYVVRSGRKDDRTNAALMRQRFPLDSTRNFSEMIATGKPVIITDVNDYAGWITVEAAPWIRSAVGAPIRLEGETIGFLSITSAEAATFTERHATQLQAFADQAAIAIRNARLYDEVRRHAGELEDQVKQRTAELELAHQRLHAILDGTGEGILYAEDRTIQFVNQAFCKLMGYTAEELVGQNYQMLLYSAIPKEDEVQRLNSLREAMQANMVWRGEIPIRRKDGTIFEGGLTISLMGDRTVFPLRSVTVVRDISREKELQAQRSNLVAYASHELRTPITNLKTRLYLLRRRPEYLDDHLVVLDEVTERMQSLVEDLLDISRMEHGLIPLRLAPLNLQAVTEAVVMLQTPEAQRKNLDLRWRQPDEPVVVSADRERLIQVITNLVTNAINYTPEGGAVNVAIREEDGSAQILVEDTGIGIASENLPFIFQPFYRVVSEVEGTGLGLSIAKEIVEMHAGKLDVRSQPGKGSIFTITLPILKAVQVE